MFLSAIQMFFITAPIACFNQFHITFGIRHAYFFHRTNNFHLVGQKSFFFHCIPGTQIPCWWIQHRNSPLGQWLNGPGFIFFLPRPLEFWEKSPSSRSLTTSCQARSGHGEMMWEDIQFRIKILFVYFEPDVALDVWNYFWVHLSGAVLRLVS